MCRGTTPLAWLERSPWGASPVPSPFRRRMAWRRLGASSYDAEEDRVRRRRTFAWAIWLLIVLVGMAILLVQNSAT